MRRCMLAVLLVVGTAITGMAAEVLVPGFAVDNYATGIPDPSNLAIDIDTGTLFYGQMGDTGGELFRVDPDGTAVSVNPLGTNCVIRKSVRSSSGLARSARSGHSCASACAHSSKTTRGFQ